MAPSDEPKMAELKRLLRRLDGLDGRRTSSSSAQANSSEQRDYVGTLRGAPDLEDGQAPVTESSATVSARSAALLAAVIAGLISTATVYVLMSADQRVSAPLLIQPINTPAKGTASPEDGRDTATMELVRSAAALIEQGNVSGARELLRRAAELGSGPAALELARSYDAAQVVPTAPEPKDTNSALARVWYERARELGQASAAPPAPTPDR